MNPKQPKLKLKQPKLKIKQPNSQGQSLNLKKPKSQPIKQKIRNAVKSNISSGPQQKVASYIGGLENFGIEDAETSNALKFMDNFYSRDQSFESGPIRGIGGRPNMKLASFTGKALSYIPGTAAHGMRKAVQEDSKKRVMKKRRRPSGRATTSHAGAGGGVGRAAKKGLIGAGLLATGATMKHLYDKHQKGKTK